MLTDYDRHSGSSVIARPDSLTDISSAIAGALSVALTVMDERPAPAPAKLLSQFTDWLEETELPGRTMSNLKTGFLPEVLADQEPTDAIDAMRQSWDEWEKGRLGPDAVLGVLNDNGLGELLSGLTST